MGGTGLVCGAAWGMAPGEALGYFTAQTSEFASWALLVCGDGLFLRLGEKEPPPPGPAALLPEALAGIFSHLFRGPSLPPANGLGMNGMNALPITLPAPHTAGS